MINILLSTYNGERYLREQLDSIITQTCSDWRLCARDDGSTDSTRSILQEYAERYPGRIRIITDGDSLGACRSFERLLQCCGDADYFAFSDQDDVWMPDKLSLCMETMQHTEVRDAGKPIVVHTDLRVVDEKLQMINPSFWQYGNIRPELLDSRIHYLAICNSVTGCAMMLNRRARQAALPVSQNAYMHDAWIALTTLHNGGLIIPVPQTTVLYRQHSHNALGAVRYRFTLGDWKRKYRLARQAYRQAKGIAFHTWADFICWKIIYIYARQQ